jgi:cyclopropane fatty-acyl-phospholipid synthase-like methyltransferase
LIAARERIDATAVAAHYDELDSFYRDVWGEHVHHGLWRTGLETCEEAVRALVQLVADAAHIGQGMRVCDIGCGYGATARMLVEERGAEITALTISPAQYAFARGRSKNAANPRFVLCDWLVNDLPTEFFHTAIAIESSEHMPDMAGFFAQARRVLRPNARLIICAWLASDAPKQWQERWLLEAICREGRMPQLGTVADYERLANAAGLLREDFEDLTRWVAPTWPKIVRRFLVKLLSQPAYVRFLFNLHARNRVFALTILRIWLAYRCGSLRYGIFTFRRI